MSRQGDRLRPADAAMLDYLVDARADYELVVAYEAGIEPDLGERRLEAMASRDLVERVSAEVVYRITERGERRLDAFEAERSSESERSVPNLD